MHSCVFIVCILKLILCMQYLFNNTQWYYCSISSTIINIWVYLIPRNLRAEKLTTRALCLLSLRNYCDYDDDDSDNGMIPWDHLHNGCIDNLSKLNCWVSMTELTLCGKERSDQNENMQGCTINVYTLTRHN